MKNTAKRTPTPVRIFDAEMMGRALRRIAHEIIERNRDLSALILAGIPVRGVDLAERIATDYRGNRESSGCNRSDRCLDAPRRCWNPGTRWQS